MSISRVSAGIGWVVAILLVVGHVVLADDSADLFFPFAMGTTATVGAFVSFRRPASPLGWAMLASGLFALVGEGAGVYAKAALTQPDTPWPGWTVGSWLFAWGWMAGNLSLWTGFLVFPSGALPGTRWRWSLWVAAAGFAAVAAFAAVAWPLRGEQLLHDGLVAPGAAGRFLPVPLVLLYTVAVAAAVSLVVRFRRSRGEERLQLKWLVFAVILFVMGLLLLATSGEGPGGNAPLWAMAPLTVGIVAVPIAMGVAILRYRLYEIDRIINRTAVYALVTVVVGSLYVLVAVLPSAIFRLGERSDLFVALATLVAAAAFGPVRRRVQGFVDRRFDRSRYDARRTVEAFGHRLRDEVDLDALGRDLLAVVEGAVRPSNASLWLTTRSVR